MPKRFSINQQKSGKARSRNLRIVPIVLAAGTSTLTLTATAGSLSHARTVQLVVQ